MENTIHYVFILDQSGSMQCLKKEVVTSYNEQVEAISKLKLNNPDSEIKFTLCVFNDEINLKFIDRNIEELKKLKPDEYQPNSCTALYDAIGITFSKLGNHINPGDQVFFAIFTDGLDNASSDFSAKDIRNKLKQAEKRGWKIKFFCQDEDNIFYQENFGITDNQIMNVTLNESGLKMMESEIFYCLDKMVKIKNP
jgi:hypothetical protein